MRKWFVIICLTMLIALIFASCAPKAETPAVVEQTAPEAEESSEDSAVPQTDTSGAAAEESEAEAEEAPVVIMAANLTGIVTFDPLTMCEQLATMLFSLTYESLVNIDPNDYGNVVPYLAESWEVSEDQRTYTLHLFPNATFASGNPVTAEDVKFSFDRSRKDSATCYGSYLSVVEDVTVVDDLTVQITTKEPDAAFLILLSTSGFAIVEKEAAMAHGATDTLEQDDTAKDWFDQNSPGTGPYILTKWEPNAEVIYEANKNWWGGTPPLSRFIVKHVEDPTLAVQMLQTGGVDLIPWLDFDLINTVKADSNLSISASDDIITYYLAMNMDPEISELSANKLIRQAVAAAIDKDEIIETIFQGYASRAPTIISAGMLGVKTEDAQPRDVELARSLLAEAGYENGIDIDLYYFSTPPEWSMVATVIQSDLAEVGINVELKPTEPSVLRSELGAGSIPFALASWGPDTPDPTQLTDIFCYSDSVIATRFNVSMPEAELLCDQLHTEFDLDERARLVEEITTVFNDYMAYTQLYSKQFVFAHSNKVSAVYLPGRFMDLSKTTKQ